MADIDLDKLKITNKLMVAEALKRGWGVSVVDYQNGLVSYDIPGKGQQLFSGVIGPYTKATDVLIADNKLTAEKYARQAGLDVPDTELYESDVSAAAFLNKHGTIVVKPIDAAHGHGVSTNVADEQTLKTAIERAKDYSTEVLLQQQVEGDNLRVFIFDEKLQAAAIRNPAEVTGDGHSSIKQLIEAENKNGSRAANYLKPLNFIDEEAARFYLGDKLNDVPGEGEVVQVIGSANMGTGGYSIDITDEIDSKIVEQSLNISKAIGIKVCGVDFMLDQVSNKAYFIEINAAPSFVTHAYPAIGKARPLAETFLDWIASERPYS